MNTAVEDKPVGYPGFFVSEPARISPTPATLKRVALAKLSGINFLTARFNGEKFLFEPWFTTLIDYGASTRFLGVYRTEPDIADDEDDDESATTGSAEPPTLCVRQSDWLRDRDLAQAREADDLREYLANGPQIDNTVVFGTMATHPEVGDVTSRLVSALGQGVTVAAAESRQSEWHEVTVEAADDRFNATFNYSPFITRCDALETHLPPWLEMMERIVQQKGIAPDAEPILSIRRSVPELLDAPFHMISPR